MQSGVTSFDQQKQFMSVPRAPRSPRWPRGHTTLRSVRCVAAALLPLAAAAAAAAQPAATEPLQPIPAATRQDPARVALGRRLFHEPRLSADGKVSCASCHDLARGGADNRTRSIGIHGRLTARNAPTVLNAALNFRQMWNGRAATLEAQVELVLLSPSEMGSTWPNVLTVLATDPSYASAFAAAYRDGLTKANVLNAISTFERTLVTADSPFDRYLRGDRAALTDLEKLGYARFKQYGCASCHQGANIGGNMFQRFGVMVPLAAAKTTGKPGDLGRFEVTGLDRDRHVYKVPSLRNVALTAPYFHDGSAATLEEAVSVMFRYQLGRVAPKQDEEAIVRFLRTLTAPRLE